MATKEKLPVEQSLALEMAERMLRIRAFETQANQLYLSAKMPGLTHLYVGEEAVAVGICSALRRDDTITSTHRGHGHLLAKGGQLNRMMAELYGKKTGYCKGKGGSMHIVDYALGILGANGIVGGGLPIADALRRFQPERAAALLIGPEGGFTDAELDALTKLPIVTRVGLGPRVLRAETAAVAALAVFQAIAGDWRRARPR